MRRESLAPILRDLGVASETVTIKAIRRGPQSRVFRVDGPDLDAFLKIYPVDLARVLSEHPDPRPAAMARCFPIAPYFSSTKARHEAVQSRIGIPVPRVLAEGRLEDGAHYVLLERVEGIPWRSVRGHGGEWRSKMSGNMGRLAARLHEPREADNAASSSDRLLELFELLHGIADQLPSCAGGFPRYRSWIHRALHDVFDRARTIDLGPFVLTHGDLHPANFLYGRHGEVAGVIDLELSCPGPAAVDFRWLSAFDGEAFARGYGLSADRIDMAYWSGFLYELAFELLSTVSSGVHRAEGLGARFLIAQTNHLRYLLRLLRDDEFRRGGATRRRLFYLAGWPWSCLVFRRRRA